MKQKKTKKKDKNKKQNVHKPHSFVNHICICIKIDVAGMIDENNFFFLFQVGFNFKRKKIRFFSVLNLSSCVCVCVLCMFVRISIVKNLK
mgnify:CR=1 FL=1